MSHWYDSTPRKSRRKRDSNPGPSALEADALTTRPTRRSGQREGRKGEREKEKDGEREAVRGGANARVLNTALLVATLPDSWHYSVSARTGWPGVDVL